LAGQLRVFGVGSGEPEHSPHGEGESKDNLHDGDDGTHDFQSPFPSSICLKGVSGSTAMV
jgi:hypothetical protein